MISWIKKQKYKIAIALCSILSIFTLFLGISKTYAYETNQFSYTIDATNETFTTIDNKSGIILSSSTNKTFNLINTTNSNEYLLLNFYVLNNNNIIQNISSITFTTIYLRNTYLQNYLRESNKIVNNPTNNMFTYIAKGNLLSENTNSIVLNQVNNSNFSLFIVNMDFVNSYDISLSQYYETYYGQIEDNYNQLQDDYETLQSDYTTLEGNYNQLQDDYETLQTNYNDLNTNYENYYNSMYMGNFANLTNINWYNNNYDVTITQEELLNNEYYSFDFAQWDIYQYFMNYQWDENNLPTGTMEIDFNFNNTNLNLLSLEFGNTNQYLTTYQVFLKDSTNAIKIINLPLEDNYTINLEYLQSLVNYSLDNHYFYMLKIYNYLYGADIPNDQKTNIKATITYDSYYYQYGYNNGVNSQQGIIQNKDAEINEKNTTIDLLQQSIRGEYQRGYRDGYEVGSNEDFSQSGFTTLLNSIMSYPVNFLRSLFNFEFMGINLFGVLTFFVSLGIVMFVIHRFKK